MNEATTEEDKEMLDLNTVSNGASQNRCFNELEAKCAELEFELRKTKDRCEALEAKVKALEEEKSALENDLKDLKRDRDSEEIEMKQENKGKEGDGNLGLDTSFDFLGNNQKKVEDLGNVVSSCVPPSREIQDTDTPSKDIFQRSPISDSEAQPDFKVVKQLTFETEVSPSKMMSPCKVTGANPAPNGVIDITESDEERDITQNPVPDRQGCESISVSTSFAAEQVKKSNSSWAENHDENLDFGENLSFAATHKRKKTCNVVTSESESDDDDDNVPISQLKRIYSQKPNADQVRPHLNSSPTATISEDDEVNDIVTMRRRLLPLRECARKSQDDKMSSGKPKKTKHQRSIPTNADADDESEEDFSDSEDENMDDFIVDDFDSECEDTSSEAHGVSNCDVDSGSGNTDSDSQDASDGDMDFEGHKVKWKFEGEMLAEFGKDPELCMKAVCALYRQQTTEEQMTQQALCRNGRGFSMMDARRGSTLGDFLTDGDPDGCLKKSVEELQEFDPEGVELCRTLAIHYSKQLFEIYTNGEDPFFP